MISSPFFVYSNLFYSHPQFDNILSPTVSHCKKLTILAD